MFNRILVDIDPEADNQQLVAKITKIAQLFEAKVLLFSSLYCHSIEYGYLFDDIAKQDAMDSYVNSRAGNIVKLAELLEAQGVCAEVDVMWGKDHNADVLARALSFKADLIIEAKNYISVVDRLFNQTVADLARDCICPLLLINDRQWEVPTKIGMGFDPFHEDDELSATDAKLLNYSGDLAGFLKVEVDVIHSVHTLPHAAIFDEHIVADYDALKGQVLMEHKARIESMITGSPLRERSQIVYLSGECHIELPRYANDNSLDLVVLGHAQRGLAERMLQGDMLDRVINDMSCDLLVIK